MQDSAQRSDRSEIPKAQPEIIFSGGRDEELYRLFQSLLEATHTASEQASAGDFSGIREHLQQQGRILSRVNELSNEGGSDGVSIQNPLKSQLRVMLQSTQEGNIRILQLLHERKKSVLSKIVEVQNRRHVFDYLR